ncbi:MAG: hypothetical protein WCE61_00120 [Candidatus Acidiferrum sp.]
MRSLGLMLLAAASLLALPAMGQEPIPQAPQKKVTIVHTHDGGVNVVMQSIVVPPKAGAPFTLTLETEWVKQLYDGGTITLVNKRRIARDAAGRIYEERWALVPKNAHRVQSIMNMIQIFDPLAHTRHDCFLLEKTNKCELLNYTRSTSNIYKPMSPATGPLPGDQGWAIHEDLGKRFIDGVETEGTHDTLIYNPGVYGNDRKMTVENEFWWSPELGLNLLSIKTDPRIGKQTFTVTDLLLGDPDPSLFQLPAGFEVVDRRQTGLPQ